jgi:hypothetical protein
MGLYEMKPGQGDHDHRFPDGHREVIRPGDRITCEPEELGGALNKFVRLDPELPRELPKVGLKIVHRGGGWFDVINGATSERINDEALRKSDAYSLIMDVTGVDASALGDIEEEAEASPQTSEKSSGTQDGVRTIILGPNLKGGLGA